MTRRMERSKLPSWFEEGWPRLCEAGVVCLLRRVVQRRRARRDLRLQARFRVEATLIQAGMPALQSCVLSALMLICPRI
jgi:hypothetical protein